MHGKHNEEYLTRTELSFVTHKATYSSFHWT